MRFDITKHQLMPSQPIAVLLCGGTIEKSYNEVTETTQFEGVSLRAIQTLVQTHIRPCGIQILFERVLQKDSLEMDDRDRGIVADKCASIHCDRIALIHGTSTMTKTADVLLKDDRLKKKTIVITGAMRPYLLDGNTDAVANVSSALTAAQILDPGVYIAMNGRVFRAGKVRKDIENGCFEECE